MTRQDDELVRRYHEASEQEDARPGAHVREAVRAHAQMIAKAAASASAGPVTAPAANQARWKISALATVAVVGLTGLLMLQFERGTPEERDTAFSHRRTEAPAAPAPAAPPTPQPPAEPSPATPRAPDSAQNNARNSTGPSADALPSKPSTGAAPAPAQTPAHSQPIAKAAPVSPSAIEQGSPDSASRIRRPLRFPSIAPRTRDGRSPSHRIRY